MQDGGWPPSWKISNGRISGTGHPIDFVFDTRVRFSGTADRMALFPVSPNARWRLAAILENFKLPYLRNGTSDRLRVRSECRVIGDGGSNGPSSGWTKSKMAADRHL